MRLPEILRPDCVVVPLAAQTKQQAIFALADLLAQRGLVSDGPMLRNAVWQREMTRTTGIGHGVAIPHGKVAGCARLVLAVGKLAQPIDFAAIDGRPVELVFLLASPVDQTGPHIQALAGISRLLSNAGFRTAVRGAQTPEQLFQLIADHDAKQPA